MKRVAATQVAKSASNAARKAQFASSRVGAAPLANNETKSKTKAAVVKKVATKKDTWNQKINRATDRAVLHVFRQAFLALDVVQTVHAHGSTASVTCTDSNNHANVFLALTTYTTPLEMNATLRQVVSFESSAHSPRVPSGEVTARAQLKFSAWKLVDMTTDGTALCVYQYVPDGAVAQTNGSCCPSLVAIVWRDGLQVHSLYAIHSIPLVTSTLLSRVATTLEDDIDPCFGLQGYTIAVSLRSFDQAVWDYEGYVVDFPSDLPPGATETCASLLVPQGALRERSRVLNEGSNGNLSIRTQAFTTTATNSIIVDVAVWDFERSLRWATSQCVAYTSSVKRPEVFDMDVSKAFEAVHLAMDTPHVGRVRLELYRFAAKTIVASLDVALLTGFVNATYGTSYGKG